VQNAHRDAALGICDRHSGHERVGDSTSGSVRDSSSSRFTGLITRKNITAATMRNVTSALKKSP
jgi:hypothetical protein